MSGETLAIVCCYGLFNQRLRKPKEIQGYRAYLLGITRYCIDHPEISTILLCGGKTDQRSTQTEAESVEPILANMFQSLGSPMPKIIRLSGLNVAQHLHEASDYLEHDGLDCIVFCDKKSHLRVWAIADYLLPFACNWRIVSFKRKDVHPKNKYILQWAEGLLCRLNHSRIERMLRAR